MKLKLLNKSIVISIICMFFIISILSSNICSLPVEYEDKRYNFLDDIKLIETYNITIYKINGYNVEKLIKSIDNEKALELKNGFNNINDNFKDTIINIEKKIELLIELEIISNEDLSDNNRYNYYKNKYFNNTIDKTKINDGANFGLFGFVIGSFFGRTSSFLNLKIFGFPLYIRSYDGGRISFFGFPKFWTMTVNNPLTFFSFAFVGLITLMPFLDMDGGIIIGGGYLVFGI